MTEATVTARFKFDAPHPLRRLWLIAVAISVLLAARAAFCAPAAGATSSAALPKDPAAAATQAIVAFDAANKLYEQGKFGEAARAYQQILEGGARSVTLYFNLGNAWFKAGQNGRAIAAFRQAELLSPRDPNVQFNLAFARKRVTTGEPPAGPFLQRLLAGLTLDEWTLLTAGAFWIGLLLLAAGELRESFRATARRYALVAGMTVILGAAAVLAYRSFQDGKAVIVVSEAVVRSGPFDEAKVLHQFRDGTELDILDRKQLSGDKGQTWFNVRNAAAQSGWIKDDQVVRIQP